MKNLQSYEEFLELNEREYEKDVKSSHLKSLWYDDKKKELEIEFLNGSTYRYYEVPWEVYKEISDYKNILQKAGFGLKKLFRPKAAEEEEKAKGTFGIRFWKTLRRGNYEYKKIK